MENNQEPTKILKPRYIPTAEFYSQMIDSLQDYSIFTLDNELNHKQLELWLNKNIWV